MKRLALWSIFVLLLVIGLVYKTKRDQELEKVLRIKQEQHRELQELIDRKLAEQQVIERLHSKAAEAYDFAKASGFDLQHAILIDFSIHSGKKRFFVWNYQTNQVELSSLVAHGYGSDEFRSTPTEIIFSNQQGSLASSLGKYKIGIRSYSQYGINVHYKLHGLEKSNDNAFKRVVVLHSYQAIPELELFPFHLPLGYSQGCPVIDNQTMRAVDKILQKKKKPVLLWIYTQPTDGQTV